MVEATDEIPAELRAELPDLLWLFHMGLIAFWVYDRSPDQVATRLAIARTVPLIVRVIRLADIPDLADTIALLHVARTLLTRTGPRTRMVSGTYRHRSDI